MIIADFISTILQSIALIVIGNFCTSYRHVNSKSKLVVLIAVFASIVGITTILVGNSSLSIIIIHVVLIIMGIVVFREDSLGATTAISIVYSALLINIFTMSNIFMGYVQYTIPTEYFKIAFILFLYVPQYVMCIYMLLNLEKVYKLYSYVRSKKMSIITLIIITLIGDFALSFNFIIHEMDNPLFEWIVYILLLTLLISVSIYVLGIEKKSNEILMLNEKLEGKINELKKIKHDYGAQISYLYGMHLMGKHDRLGNSLKEIIDGYKNITSELNTLNKDSIIAMVVNNTELNGVNVIVDEKISLKGIDISEMELQRIISNILRNSVDAMDGTGIIKIRAYNKFNEVRIELENNGPHIPQNIIDKIFEAGFTTKENSNGENGYGLAIVRELVDKHKGKVSVSSDEKSTKFTIKIPIALKY